MPNFTNFLSDYFAAENKTKQLAIEDQLWAEYGTQGAVMIMDMSGFSLVTQRYGIVYYLSMIHRMQQITKPTIEKYNGQVVKFVADNVFARFPTTAEAIESAIEINHLLNLENAKTPDLWDIQVSAGIDFGKFLLTNSNDYFGDVVNKASKLGEDIARGGEILVTASAMDTVKNREKFQTEALEFNISGIKLDTYSISY
ncbi:adenylate/guanylate cyclase domain-containing protein [Catenovulum maritimum]|uniref:adenylate/guanylate cyclase domain-containing protein n=1 Tax=Catenovulum maritimum TaxID=1513271 RepID=UPI0006606071|nr:adenylate/guanylate cyclase domain-containing protein [Catenovulum maritimum]